MRLIEIINELVVTDIEKTINFYKEYLGFEVIEQDGDPIVWVKMKKDDSTIKFKYDSIEELKKLYNGLLDRNVEIFMEWKETEYGSVEFGILDPDGNMLILSF